MLKDLLNAWARKIATPQSNVSVSITPPNQNDWSYFYTAPENGWVYLFASKIYACCVSNISTGQMYYLNSRGIIDTDDMAFCIRCSKGQRINLYYGKDSGVSPDLRCTFVPDTGSV